MHNSVNTIFDDDVGTNDHRGSNPAALSNLG